MSIHRIDVSEELKEEAVNNADTSHCDRDRGRRQSQQQYDALVGYIAEKLAEKFFRNQGYSVKQPTSRDHDLLVNDGKVEIKGRKTWNYSNPDLLIRKKLGIACDVYVQIDLHTVDDNQIELDLSNLSYGEIVGFVCGSDIHQYGEPFMEGKRNETDIVPREKLRPIESVDHFL